MDKSQQIHIRVTPEERLAYMQAAKDKGVELSTWLRDLASQALGNASILKR